MIFEENDGTEIPFTEMFEYLATLGSGGFGFVVAALEKSTGEEVAIKVLNKEKASQKVIKLFKKEANSLEMYDHPNIVKFRFLHNYSNYVCLGMELCLGGTLMDWIIQQRQVEYPSFEEYEEKCAEVTKHILEGLHYLHNSQEMIHRDLKPANILLSKKNDISSVKICDFGLANNVGSSIFDQNYENVGTIMYQAPEQMDESRCYSKAADLWAVGMIIYEMVTKGGHPILGEDIHCKMNMTPKEYKLRMDKFSIDLKKSTRAQSVSDLAKNLITNLCSKKANMRYNCSRALLHPWITRDANDKIPLTFQEELEINLLRMDSEKSIMSHDKGEVSKAPDVGLSPVKVFPRKSPEKSSTISKEYSRLGHQNGFDHSEHKFRNKNSSISKDRKIKATSKISVHSKLSKRSDFQVKKRKNPTLVHKSAKKRVLTVNKALNPSSSSHRKEKAKLCLPPIINRGKLFNVSDSKSTTSRNRYTKIRRKLDTNKIQSISEETAMFLKQKSPVKIPFSKRLSDPFDLGMKISKNFDFSVKKPCKVCHLVQCQCSIPKSSKYQPQAVSQSGYSPSFKSTVKGNHERASLTRIEVPSGFDPYTPTYGKENIDGNRLPKPWLYSAKVLK
ncbi:unnamed protein product [Moneuplotes crassus]|uniref:Protein kinase domain-containing protein n=1 Tax=Euplotes crassus TaxID=5936 RepID=A0AAD1Y0I5_EUPCR|nr:unnamed protein product [Moneuplotes crassus]